MEMKATLLRCFIDSPLPSSCLHTRSLSPYLHAPVQFCASGTNTSPFFLSFSVFFPPSLSLRWALVKSYVLCSMDEEESPVVCVCGQTPSNCPSQAGCHQCCKVTAIIQKTMVGEGERCQVSRGGKGGS